MLSHNLNNPNLNYNYARNLAVDNSDWERVVDCDGPFSVDGKMNPPDMFKLEFSGWKITLNSNQKMV